MAIGTDGNIGKDPNSSTSQDINTPDVDGGTIDGATIGGTTPAAGTFTAINGTSIGATTVPTLRATIDEDAEPASDTLTANQCSGGLINNFGQDADAVIQLPTIAAGYNFTVVLGTTVAKYYRIKAGTNDKIYLDGVAGSDNGYVGVASAAAGNAITFVAFQTGASAYDWYASTISGGWVAG